MTEYDKDNIIMNVLHTVGFPISRPAVMIMLEDGMVTEERPFVEYMCAKNISEALDNPDIPTENILFRNIPEKYHESLLSMYNQYVKSNQKHITLTAEREQEQ